MSAGVFNIPHLYDVLGAAPDAQVLTSLLHELYSAFQRNKDYPLLNAGERTPIVKTYPDKTVYHSYPNLGLDLEFRATESSDEGESLQLVGIDIENHELNDDEKKSREANEGVQFGENRRSKRTKARSLPFGGYPILIEPASVAPETPRGDSGPRRLNLTPRTTGKDFIDTLGEPGRKGGQDVLRSGSGIWLEWTWDTAKPVLTSVSNDEQAKKKVRHGFFVQWRGPASFGPQKWDKGRDRTWATLKIFIDH